MYAAAEVRDKSKGNTLTIFKNKAFIFTYVFSW